MGRYRRFDPDFQEGAVRLVFETGKPIAQVAKSWASTRGRWVTGWPRPADSAVTGAGRWVRTSGPSSRACARRTPSCGCSVICSSARWPSGWTRRWAGSGGRVHRRPEGAARHPARDRVPGAGGEPGVVLQVALRRRLATAGPSAAACGRGAAAVCEASRPLRVATDHRRPARAGLAGSARTPSRPSCASWACWVGRPVAGVA
jgi:transposase-like protein